MLCKDGPIKYSIIRIHNGMENPQFNLFGWLPGNHISYCEQSTNNDAETH